MSTIEVNKITPVSGGTAITLGDSGDTFTAPTGVGLTITDELKTNKISPASGTAFTLGDSGDTFTVPSGATITNSGTATGFGGGKILQVLGQKATTEVQNNTTTYADTGVTIDITPSATSSKIAVFCTINGIRKTYENTANGLILQLLRDSTSLVGGLYSGYDGVAVTRYMSSISVSYLDSPSSTSALTYKMQFKNNTNNNGVIVQSDDVAHSSIVVMEVGA